MESGRAHNVLQIRSEIISKTWIGQWQQAVLSALEQGYNSYYFILIWYAPLSTSLPAGAVSSRVTGGKVKAATRQVVNRAANAFRMAAQAAGKSHSALGAFTVDAFPSRHPKPLLPRLTKLRTSSITSGLREVNMSILGGLIRAAIRGANASQFRKKSTH